jgi:glutathione reductase (NADPH)
MAKDSYDVLILGGGNAGLGVTVPTCAAGMSVALVEDRDLGGTCPNRGCTPKKVLVAAAHALHEIEQAQMHCIEVEKPRLDWAALIDRERKMISGIPDSVAETMRARGVDVFRERARFVGQNQVAVGNRTIETKHIVIATGSTPRVLPIRGVELMITSDEVLSERDLPARALFIGGGVIALELGHVYARAGTKVTILEVLPRLLPGMDADAVDQIKEESERIGIEFYTDASVKRVERANGALRTIFGAGGKDYAVISDRVVNGAGRVPNVEHLDLDAGQVAHDKGRIKVDEFLNSTSNPAVYAAGDVLASPQLSPIATYEGRIVGRNIIEGPKHKPDYAGIPACVYTVPALASVGLSEQAAKNKGLSARIIVSDMTDWLSTKTYAETRAWAKVLVDEKTDRILGAHMVGHAGEELINVFALAMAHGIKATDIRNFVFAYPSFSADIKSML